MWPESLNCDKYPEDSSDQICISPNVSSASSSSKNQNTYSTPVSVIKIKNRNNNGFNDYKNSYNSNNSSGFSHRSIGRTFICPVQLKAPPVMGYELHVGGKVTKDCGAPCNSLFFNENERTILRYWTGTWAALNCLTSLFTVC
jgi:frizzled 1/7